MEWIPLFAGGAVIYGVTTWVAGRLLRRETAAVEPDASRRGRTRAPSRDTAEDSARSRFSLGLLHRAPTPIAKEDAKRKPAVKLPKPPAEPFNGPVREAVNRQVAVKIEQIAAEIKPGPDTLTMDQAVTQPIAQDDLVEATREAHELVGKIQSLDFTLDEKDPMGDTAIVDIVTLEVAKEEPNKTPEQDLGATLLLDTEDLLKAIRGGPPTTSPVVDPIAIAPVPASPEAVPAGPLDWDNALKALRDSNAIADDAGNSFFDASAGSRDMGTTQLFRLDTPLVAANPQATGSPAPRSGASAVDAVADESAQFAAPDLVLPDFSLPEFATTAARAALEQSDRPKPAPAPGRAARERSNAAGAQRPPRKPIDGVPIEHAQFHRLAVAHDDIQAARVAFESLLDSGEDPANPSFRALLFGALIAYGRPFQHGRDAPIAMTFSSERFSIAHAELLAAREQLMGAADAGHDQVLRIAGEAEGGASFAVQTELLNDARLPMYVALCNFLEAQLLDLLHEIGEEALAES